LNLSASSLLGCFAFIDFFVNFPSFDGGSTLHQLAEADCHGEPKERKSEGQDESVIKTARAKLHVVPLPMKNLSIDFLVYFSINSKTLCRFCGMKNFSVSK
jgi:hypothetical protein